MFGLSYNDKNCYLGIPTVVIVTLIFYLKQLVKIDYSSSNRSITNSLRSAGRGYYDEDEEGSMDNFIIDDGLDQEEEVRIYVCVYVNTSRAILFSYVSYSYTSCCKCRVCVCIMSSS